MTDDKKVTAAIAAVMSYIQDEEAMSMQAAMSGMPQAPGCFSSNRSGCRQTLGDEWQTGADADAPPDANENFSEQ